MKGFFITATDTDAGKTFITAGLLQVLSRLGYKTLGFKPVASGCVLTQQGLRNEDALKLINAANTALDYPLINPYAFEPAIAPHIAAQQAGVTIDLESIAAAIHQCPEDVDYVFIEGVGGWLVPLNAQQSVADLAELLAIILVVNMRLGCINQALLTAQAMEQKGLTITGWIANQAPQNNTVYKEMDCLQENIQSLQSRLSAPLLGIIPNNAEQKNFSQLIDVEKYIV